MLDSIGNVLKKGIDKITSAVFVDKNLVESVIKDLQRALIGADVNIALVKEISAEIREAGEKYVKNVDKKEHLIKLLNDKIIEILGGEKKELTLEKKEKILLVGLYGTGKTTTISKLAFYYKKRGRKVAMLGLDVHRPAASEQLEQLGKKIEVAAFTDKKEKSPLKIYEKYKKDLAQTLKDSVGITGVIITRMDSSAKAGGALTACYEAKAPVYFIGTGEHQGDIETFNPNSFVSRLLGMGDLESLLERVRNATDEKSQERLAKNLESGKFTLDDFYQQIESMQGMGSFSKIKEMIPGFSKAKIPDNALESQEAKMKHWKYAIQSMTPHEKENPEILEKETSRLQRIARGSGTTTSEIRQLLKQYKMIKDLAKGTKSLCDISDPSQMSQKQMMKLAKKFGKGKFKF